MKRTAPPNFRIPDAAHHLVYAVIRPWGRWGMRLWHRLDPEVPGAEQLASSQSAAPARLLFGGHQNGLADPLLACVTLQPQLHFFTRADAFRPPLTRWLLLRLNMMPIYRPKDRVADMADRNRLTFARAHDRLERGATCGIFPEAGHRDQRRIRRFRHGSARFVAGALQRLEIRSRGLEIIPMHLDFERYAGYRTGARIRLGPPVPYNDIPGLDQDAGTARVLLSERMHAALLEQSVHLTEGELYDVHLAIQRFLEGAMGVVPLSLTQRAGQELALAPDAAIAEFKALCALGMAHPRETDDFAAAGRVIAGRTTALMPLMWRWPAWVVFLVTCGIWPRLMERAAARRIEQVAFRTTFSIPMTMIAVSLSWLVMALGAGVATGNPLVVPLVLLALRVTQHIAMPLEDALIDARLERRVSPWTCEPFFQNHCVPMLGQIGILN